LDDLDEIRAFARHAGPSCTAGMALAHMPEPTRSKLLKAMDVAAAQSDSRVTWLAISDWLRGLQYHLTDFTLRRHYKKRCKCG
jgi:hypothetical protein